MKTTPQLPRLVTSVVVTATGSGFLPVPMLSGLLGMPLMLCGFILCVSLVLSSLNREFPRWQRLLGGGIAIGGLLLLLVGCLSAAILTFSCMRLRLHQQPLYPGLQRELNACLFVDLLATLVISFGMWLSSDRRWPTCLLRAAYWASYFPLAALAVMAIFSLFASLGM